jgi:polysaccharide chain length determinant protein (PEP-CTERM system associated)
MQDIIAQVRSYTRGIWQNRWTLVLVAWVVCAAGWLYVYKMPDQYQAHARVYVDTDSVLRPLLRGLAVEADLRQRLAFMSRSLLSRPNLEQVARMTDLDLQAQDQQQLEQVVDRLARQIQVQDAGRVNLYTITYRHSDPQTARAVVQSLLTIFVESSLGTSRRDSDTAQRFLDQQIREYEGRLLEAEQRLKEFKRRHVGLMPGEQGDYYDRLRTARLQLEQAQLELREAEQRRGELERQLVGEEPTFGIAALGPITAVASAPAGPLDGRLAQLRRQLEDMRMSYTDRHPDVMALQRTIGELEAQRPAQPRATQNSPGAPDSAPLETNPIYQHMRLALAETEAEVAAIRVRVGEYESRVAQLTELVDTIPGVEAELARLNRDYDVHRQNYATLVARLESAKISQEAEQTSENVKFRVVDPPHVPRTPAGPNRTLLATVVLIAGLGAGMGLAFLMSQIRPTFGTRQDLHERMRMPVLGSVALAESATGQMRRGQGLASFVLASAGLLVIYGLVLTLNFMEPGTMTNLLSWRGALS